MRKRWWDWKTVIWRPQTTTNSGRNTSECQRWWSKLQQQFYIYLVSKDFPIPQIAVIIKGVNRNFSVYKPGEKHFMQWSKLISAVMRPINHRHVPPKLTLTEEHSVTSGLFPPEIYHLRLNMMKHQLAPK